MPTTHLVFHRLAAHEYRSARNWYRERSVEVAQRFVTAVDNASTRILMAPESMPLLTKMYHYIRVSRFPYVLIVRRVDDNKVMVVAVAHTSRRPGYWRGRT